MADDGKRSENKRDQDAEKTTVPPASDEARTTDEVTSTAEDKIEGPGITPASVAPEMTSNKPVIAATGEATAVAPPAEEGGEKPAEKPPETDAMTKLPEGKKPEEEAAAKPKIDPMTTLNDGPKDENTDAKAASEPAKLKPATADMDAETPAEEGEKDYKSDPRYSTFLANFREKNLPVLHEMWNDVTLVNDELMESIGMSGSIKKSKYGLDFNLPNGHKIEWHANLGGSEFIGMSRQTDKFDAEDARATVAASKSRGWEAINVHGSTKQKELLWLEAQRQGLPVNNFVPLPDSDIAQQWAREQAERDAKRLDKEVAGVSAHGNMNPSDKELKDARDAVDASVREEQNPPAENKDAGKPPAGGEAEKKPVAEAEAEKPAAEGEAEKKPVAEAEAEKPVAAAEEQAAEGVNSSRYAKLDSNKGDKTVAPPAAEADAELPAGSIPFQQHIEREMRNPDNSPEVRRGYEEIRAALFEGKLDQGDIDAIQLGRSEGMGGNTMRDKMETTLTNNEFNKLADGIEGLMQKKGVEGFKIASRPALDEVAPSGAAAQIEVVNDGGANKRTNNTMKPT